MMYVVQKRDTGEKEWESVEEFYNKQEANAFMEYFLSHVNTDLRIKTIKDL